VISIIIHTKLVFKYIYIYGKKKYTVSRDISAITLTFCDAAENHVGMEQLGKKINKRRWVYKRRSRKNNVYISTKRV
jgi:hypothetical protein